MDGELDVDRADYLLRDGRELGFEFANYDLERLVSSLALVRTDEMGFATAVREQGLSALESFLLSRARSNQLLIRHHKVAQVAAALRYATADALISSTTGAGFLQQLGRLSTTDPMSGDESRRYLSQFAEFDDVWWTGVLRKHHAQTEGLVRDCLDVLLKRERKLRSVWKRKGELGADAVREINAAVELHGAAARFKALKDRGVLFVIHKFRPFRTRGSDRHSILMVQTGVGPQPVTALSPLVRSLQDAWEDDIHLHAFIRAGDDVQAAREFIFENLGIRRAGT